VKRQDPDTSWLFSKKPWGPKLHFGQKSPLSSDVLLRVLYKGVPASEGSVAVRYRACTS